MNIKRMIGANIREISLIAIMIVLSLFVNIRSGGRFFTPENISDMLTETSVMAIAAIGMMLVILTGGIDLSVGAVMALSAMCATSVLKMNQGIPIAVIILIAVLIGALSGVVNGFLIAKLKILPIIATLGTMNIFRGITYLVSGGKWIMQQDMGRNFLSLAVGKVLGVNNLIIFAVIIYVIAFFFLTKIRTGRKIYAVGNSAESARVSGINVNRILMLSYILLGILAGLAGVLYVCKYGVAQGETGVGYEMNVIAICVLGGVSITGGRGKVPGVLLGAILIGILNNAMPLIKVSSFWQDAIRGFIILLSITSNALIQRNVERKALQRRKV